MKTAIFWIATAAIASFYIGVEVGRDNNPIVNVTTEQGITGDVIVGNVMPRAIESIG